MDVFVTNVPLQCNPNQLRQKLLPHCKAIGVYAIYVNLWPVPGRNLKHNGTVTFPSIDSAKRFLDLFGPKTFGQTHMTIEVFNCKLFFRPSNKPPRDTFIVKSVIQKQKAAVREKETAPKGKALRVGNKPQAEEKRENMQFDVQQLDCGVWGFELPDFGNAFESRYTLRRSGLLRFRRRAIILEVESNSDIPGYTIKFLHSSIRTIFTDRQNHVIFTLSSAPRIYQQRKTPADTQLGEVTWKERISSIDDDHACFVAISLVYRVALRFENDLPKVLRLSSKNGNPPISSRAITITHPQATFEVAARDLLHQLQTRFPFIVAFQLNALFSNGDLPPQSILPLLPRVEALLQTVGDTEAAIILKDFVDDLRPDDLHYRDSDKKLIERLEFSTARMARLRTPTQIAADAHKNTHMVWIYHAMVTPAGCYFYGPRLEASNRVLRKYGEYTDYFLRVTFAEEDGTTFYSEPRVSNDQIYEKQFMLYLEPANGGIVIGGRRFSFLGFSSSSLRGQTCWFMAPFTFGGEILTVGKLIGHLGDFSSITCPGRYMARVGQAFSDTVGSIHVPLKDEKTIEDVKKIDANGKERIFTDGIGTISQQMVYRIWDESEQIGQERPTVFQIRFGGAKGVICLDPRLTGDKLCLRKSMIKFTGSEDRNIEICSWAKRLPMFLNRPLIKVLEDLKVPFETFQQLQDDAVDQLRDCGSSAILAANFLKRQSISSNAVRLWWVVEALKNLGIEFREDSFLERVFELALLSVLREIKYRARIPVPYGVTLVGVTDETGVCYLEEGQIYCTSSLADGRNQVIIGKVMITRSPVHHPGDVQMVDAVRVPRGSPLELLKNCVVFSQKGDRDLPSMLAGGDLDGDLYNIIYDRRFICRTHEVAEYPRRDPVDLKRPVQPRDVVQFFIDFMKNNLLGLISTRHLQIADQEDEGVFHKNCLKLAELHSIAVDFPKTGIKVDRKDFPRASPAKPDFMAPGPRVLVAKDKVVHDILDDADYEDDEEQATSYYPSDNALGKLYRKIDEQQFLDQVHSNSPVKSIGVGGLVIQRLWKFVERETESYQWLSYVDFALDVRDRYEKALNALMWDYSDMPWKHCLTEVEVFIGTIIGGPDGKQTKRQREASAAMKEDFDQLAISTIDEMKGNSKEETLGRSMACLYLCLPQSEKPSEFNLQSFAWVSAGVLLTEVDKLQKGREGISRRKY